MAEIIPFPHSSIERTLEPLNDLRESSEQKLKQCLHDLRSPLSVFEVAVEKHLGEEPIFSQACKRLKNLVGEMEDVVRGKEKNQSPATASSIGDVIENIVRETSLAEGVSSHMFCVSLSAASGCEPPFDVEELKRILSNLLKNALEAGGTEPVEISYERNKKHHLISIKDSGQGLSLSQLHQLERNSSSSKRPTGGLGLTHARNTLAKFGGSVHISSVWGQGSKVTLQIPHQGLRLLS